MTKALIEEIYTGKKLFVEIDLEKYPDVKEGSFCKRGKEVFYIDELWNKKYKEAIDIPGYKELLDHLVKQPGIVKMAEQLKKDYPDGIPGSQE